MRKFLFGAAFLLALLCGCAKKESTVEWLKTARSDGYSAGFTGLPETSCGYVKSGEREQFFRGFYEGQHDRKKARDQ